MPITPFSLPKRDSLITVTTVISGPAGDVEVSLVLDTGCTQTAIRPGYLKAIGYNLEQDGRPLQVLTASKIEKAYQIKVGRISALGISIKNLDITAQPLPPQFEIDGLLGLNFFKKLKKELVIDFDNEEIRF